MWLIKLKGGVEITEAELGCWDNVPANAEIEALAIVLSGEAGKYVVEYCGYEQYCCARIGSADQNGFDQIVGVSVSAVKNGQILEHEIFAKGMKLRNYPQDKCEVPEQCFRRGV